MATSASRGFSVRSMADVGALVRDARTRRGWTQADVCKQLGVSRAWLVDIERGRHDRAEMGKVLRLLDVVGVDLLALHGDIREPETSAQDNDVDLDAFLDGIGGGST